MKNTNSLEYWADKCYIFKPNDKLWETDTIISNLVYKITDEAKVICFSIEGKMLMEKSKVHVIESVAQDRLSTYSADQVKESLDLFKSQLFNI